MIFSLEQVKELVKMQLLPQQRGDDPGIELAMGAALDELSMRLKSKSHITSYSQTVAVSTRTLTLSGESNDLRYIFALKMGTGSEARILTFKEQQSFLRDYDRSDVDAGIPSFYTQLTASEGYPTIKFDVPVTPAQTLVTYYYVDMTPDNVTFSKSIAAVAAGTVAYYNGIESPSGAGWYANFKQLAALSRASDSHIANEPTDVLLSHQDRGIRSIFRTIQLRRS